MNRALGSVLQSDSSARSQGRLPRGRTVYVKPGAPACGCRWTPSLCRPRRRTARSLERRARAWVRGGATALPCTPGVRSMLSQVSFPRASARERGGYLAVPCSMGCVENSKPNSDTRCHGCDRRAVCYLQVCPTWPSGSSTLCGGARGCRWRRRWWRAQPSSARGLGRFRQYMYGWPAWRCCLKVRVQR